MLKVEKTVGGPLIASPQTLNYHKNVFFFVKCASDASIVKKLAATIRAL